jgi:hypothetical protein
MSKLGDFISRILLKMFPQRKPIPQTSEQQSYEKGGRIFRGIKGNKDKSRIIEFMLRKGMGT